MRILASLIAQADMAGPLPELSLWRRLLFASSLEMTGLIPWAFVIGPPIVAVPSLWQISGGLRR